MPNTYLQHRIAISKQNTSHNKIGTFKSRLKFNNNKYEINIDIKFWVLIFLLGIFVFNLKDTNLNTGEIITVSTLKLNVKNDIGQIEKCYNLHTQNNINKNYHSTYGNRTKQKGFNVIQSNKGLL